MPSAPRIEIRSAHDIVAALCCDDLATRLAVCQAAAARPTHILAYGAAAGIDLVASFLAAAKVRESLPYRKAVLGALVHFDDPRVVELFRQVLLSSSESDVLRLAAKRVALDDTAESRRFLRERLLNEKNALRVRSIAAALANGADFSTAERLRLIIAGIGSPDAVERWPRDNPESAACWGNELRGPFALHARRLLHNGGTRADLVALLPAWSECADSDRAWLLVWGSGLFGATQPPAAVCSMLVEALSQQAKPLLLAALGWCRACPSAVPVEVLKRHSTSADSELRLAALGAIPAPALDWWQLARTDAEPAVRALAIERALPISDVAGTSPELAALMEDSDWRVRAAVVRALSQSGAAVLDTARGWLAHANPQVRAGALQILIEQGQERWLMDQLLG